jgi:carbon monoxide dehydrogenase subunit G
VKVEGEREFAAPLQTVWEVLNDPSKMAKTMPGVESFDIQDDRHWRANVKIPLGLGGMRMSVDFEKTEEREPEFAKLHAKGNGVGAIMNMDTAFHLSEGGAGTQMKWEADVHILGPVASMGQRVLQPIVNQQVGNVLSALDVQVQEAAGGTGGAAAVGADDAGPPGTGPAEPEGSSGAEEGLSPLAPESYESKPEGPTASTESS